MKDHEGKQTEKITQTGLYMNIEVYCETGQELIAHLSNIRSKLKKELKKMGGDIPDGVDVYFEDSNCYGNHVVKIDPEFS